MIKTGQPKIPWHFVFMMVMPGFAFRMAEMGVKSLLPFTISKFTNDPALVTFLVSTDTLIGMTLCPLVAWKSDRIWTRIGRRKPFVMIAMFGGALVLPILPFTGSLLLLGAAICFYNVVTDINMYELLYMETVPIVQRGRAAAIQRGVWLLAMMYMNLMLLGNFDNITRFDLGFAQLTITGEQVAYWTIAVVLFFMAIFVAFNTQEVPPKNRPDPNERFSYRMLLNSILLDKQLLKIYMLLFAMMAMTMGLGALNPLLLTVQFGYSKMALAKMYFVLQIVEFSLFLPFAGFLADRFDRVKLFMFGISLSSFFPITYWIYIHFFAPNQIPPIHMIMAFLTFDHLVDFTATVAMAPLAYDYVPRGRMGTLFAGMSLVRPLMRFCLGNTVGLFVKFYSKIFCAPDVIDYTSGYLLLFVVGLVGVCCAIFFLRERAAGRIIPYGKIEHEQAQKAREEAEQKTKEEEPAPVVPAG